MSFPGVVGRLEDAAEEVCLPELFSNSSFAGLVEGLSLACNVIYSFRNIFNNAMSNAIEWGNSLQTMNQTVSTALSTLLTFQYCAQQPHDPNRQLNLRKKFSDLRNVTLKIVSVLAQSSSDVLNGSLVATLGSFSELISTQTDVQQRCKFLLQDYEILNSSRTKMLDALRNCTEKFKCNAFQERIANLTAEMAPLKPLQPVALQLAFALPRSLNATNALLIQVIAVKAAVGFLSTDLAEKRVRVVQFQQIQSPTVQFCSVLSI